MTNANKAKGDTFERATLAYLQAHGFPWAERTRAGYARDWGDIHVDPIGRSVIAQCKNHARHAFPEWLTQLRSQIADAGARIGFLVVKRRGVGDPGRSLAVMELADLLALLRAAGYGQDPEGADGALSGPQSAQNGAPGPSPALAAQSPAGSD